MFGLLTEGEVGDLATMLEKAVLLVGLDACVGDRANAMVVDMVDAVAVEVSMLVADALEYSSFRTCRMRWCVG